MVKQITQNEYDGYLAHGWKSMEDNGRNHLIVKKVSACRCCLNTAIYTATSPGVFIVSTVLSLPLCLGKTLWDFARAVPLNKTQCPNGIYSVNEHLCDCLSPGIRTLCMEVEIVHTERSRLTQPVAI